MNPIEAKKKKKKYGMDKNDGRVVMSQIKSVKYIINEGIYIRNG